MRRQIKISKKINIDKNINYTFTFLNYVGKNIMFPTYKSSLTLA